MTALRSVRHAPVRTPKLFRGRCAPGMIASSSMGHPKAPAEVM